MFYPIQPLECGIMQRESAQPQYCMMLVLEPAWPMFLILSMYATGVTHLFETFEKICGRVGGPGGSAGGSSSRQG